MSYPLFIASTIDAISCRVLAALLLAALQGSATEVSKGALSWEIDRADPGGELKSLSRRREIVTLLVGRSEIWKASCSLFGSSCGGERDNEEEDGAELHVDLV